MKKQIGNALALYPVPLAVVGTMVHRRPCWALAGHVGILGGGRVAVSLAKSQDANQGIRAMGRLSLNLVDENLLPQADKAGRIGKAGQDQAELFSYLVDDSGIPMIEQAPVVMTCRVEDVHAADGFENFICQIRSTYAEKGILDDAGAIDYRLFKPVLFAMPTGTYLSTGDVIGSGGAFEKDGGH